MTTITIKLPLVNERRILRLEKLEADNATLRAEVERLRNEMPRKATIELVRALTAEVERLRAMMPSAGVVSTIRMVFETDEHPAIFEIAEYQSWLARVSPPSAPAQARALDAERTQLEVNDD